MPKLNQSEVDPVLEELGAIKRLLIIGLLRKGARQGHVASALGVSEATMSRLFPKGLIKALKDGRDESK